MKKATFKNTLMPWLIGFFGIMFCANAVMIYLAQTSWRGLVTEHPYEKGLAYNKALDEKAAQQALGWQSRLTHTNNTFTVTLTNNQAAPLSQADVSVLVRRPTHEGLDQTVNLAPSNVPGEYQAPFTFTQKGVWDITLNVTHGDQHYTTKQRLVVP